MTSTNSNKDMKDKVTLSWSNSPIVPNPQAESTSRPQPRMSAQTVKRQTFTAPQEAPKPAAEEKPRVEQAKPEAMVQEPAPAQPADAKPEKKKGGWAAAFFDFILVMLLLGAIGGGAWYVYQQMELYRVPSPLEVAQAEHLELCKQHEQLQDAAYKADEALHMRERISHLNLQIDAVNRQLAEHKQGIETERGRVLSLQREIRQEDKTSRSVARNLLIGLPVGNVSTTNGRVYANAIIHRLEAGRITLRTPQGQVRFPVAMLIKDNLPDMARYAFGIDDMVDMSDFEAAPGSPAPKKRRQGKIISPRKPSAQVTEPNYEPAPGAPVVEAPAQPAIITVEPGSTPEEADTWQAPEGALPIE